MKTVAAGDEVAFDLVADAVLDISDARAVAIEIERFDVGGLIDGGEAGRLAGVHQVERHLGLAVDHDGLAGGAVHVDAVARAAEREFDTMVHQPLAMSALPGADLVEQRHRAFLEQAGADPAEHILRRLALENDVIDAVKA
jgi:hypothetical protein